MAAVPTFPLNRLALVTYKQVLKCMDVYELFCLSLISVKSKNAVKSITKKQPFTLYLERTDSITMAWSCQISEMGGMKQERKISQIGENPIVQNTTARIYNCLRGFELTYMDDCSLEESVNWAKSMLQFLTETFNVTKIDCIFDELKDGPTDLKDESIDSEDESIDSHDELTDLEDKAMISLLEYIQKDLKLELNIVTFPSRFVLDCLYTYILDNCMDAKYLNISCHPSVSFFHDVEHFRPRSDVGIINASWITLKHLEKFLEYSKEIHLVDLKVSSQELNMFLKLWQQSDNLENIQLLMSNIDFEIAVQGLEIDPKGMQVLEDYELNGPGQCFEIQRQDGVKATILKCEYMIIIRTNRKLQLTL